MMNWLRRLIFNHNRDVFPYWDGRRQRRADPLVVCRVLQTHGEFDAESHPQKVDSGDDEAIEVTAKAVRDAFGIPEFDGSNGLTESELIALLTDFWIWSGEVKKKVSRLPISPEPTGSESSTESTTPSDTACISISHERSGDEAGK